MERLRIILMCTLFLHALVKGTEQEVDAYLNEIEQNVKEIANQATRNDKDCDLLIRTCVAPNCSRWACHSLSGKDGHGCLEVPRNLSCSCCTVNSTQTCQKMHLSLKRSDVRVAPDTRDREETKASICTQRQLDITFEKLWNNKSRSSKSQLSMWLFFGSVSGVQRSYPGMQYTPEITTQDCNTYDPRKRPWYIGAISVTKDLHILLDMSNFMERKENRLNKSERNIDVAKSIIAELVETLSTNDSVRLSTYNENGINATQVLEIGDDTNKTQLEKFVSEVQTNTSYKYPPDIVFSWAIKQFKNTRNKLKIIMVFTTQSPMENLNNTAIGNITKNINSQHIKTFIYHVGHDTSNDSKFSSFINSTNSSYENVGGSSNALWRLRSYFSYIAFLRQKSVNKSALWSDNYTDSHGMGSVFSAYFPAFGENNQLIGVAGIDIIESEIEALGGAAEVILRREGLYSSSIEGDLKYKIQVDNNTCPSLEKTNSLCGQSTTSTIDCCCKKSNKRKIIIIVCVVGGGLLIAITLIGIYYLLKSKVSRPPPPPRPPSPQWESMK